ncbi:MAG: hypothetical protein D6698_03900 [Gammaproteobacteria bacterium]|nr:MAG: hypothetical protein D6698_03900 [Gammaproteobacteria bacterium]
MKIKWISLAAGLFFSSSLLAAELSPGETLYLKHCSSCHGESGDGQGPRSSQLNSTPTDFTSLDGQSVLTHERLLKAIRQGRPGTAMVPWDGLLTDQEITAIADYIESAFLKTDKHLLAGRNLYIKHCAPCHGDDGNSARWTRNSLNPAPRNFTTEKARRELSRERMIGSVTRGRPGTAMMPFSSRLSAAEIESVVDYIRATFMKKNSRVAGNDSVEMKNTNNGEFDAARHLSAVGGVDMSLDFPMGLKGDFFRGRKFFMSNCFTCHGRKGNGRGPRSKFIFPKPRNFHSQESKTYLNRPALFIAIGRGKPGTVMPAWSKVLSDQQIADVAEFVFQAFIQEKGIGESAEAVDKKPGWKKKQP